jgi:hypothetical protein
MFPVLTISTSTDYHRPLRADSFVVLRFDKTSKDVESFKDHALMGGYYDKYVKYKQKYLDLKSTFDE